MRLLQVCNVGNILGGTAACAWTVTRALPQIEHAVVFLSRITDETRRAFANCRIDQWDRIDGARLAALGPHAVILHNTRPQCVGRITSAVTVQYVHSAGPRAAADVTVYCSRWLAEQCRGSMVHGPLVIGTDRGTAMDNGPRTSDAPVLYQAVPKPRRPVGGDTRALREHLVIGRICTPVARKWPGELPAFYERLAGLFPRVEWEFVGCPSEVHPPLAEACHGRAAFFPASWDARARLWRWDALLYHNPHVTESFGRTAAEAMRAGCIPIVDAAGGFVEQVVEGCGLLCASAEEFAAAVERLHDPGERRGMSRRALAHADGMFSIERHRREIMSVLSDVT